MGVKVLVVDDDKILGEMLQILLELRSFDVIVSKEAVNTEELILNNQIELVLLDKLISGVDGTDVCRNLKNNNATAHVPVIMMTAMHNAAKVCKEAGADGFIAKPFEIKDLFLKIEQVLIPGGV